MATLSKKAKDQIMDRAADYQTNALDAFAANNNQEAQKFVSRIHGLRVAVLSMGDNETESDLAIMQNNLEKLLNLLG